MVPGCAVSLLAHRYEGRETLLTVRVFQHALGVTSSVRMIRFENLGGFTGGQRGCPRCQRPIGSGRNT